MSRHKVNAPNIELGVIDSYEVEDAAIIDEDVSIEDNDTFIEVEAPADDVGTISKGKIVGVGKSTISFVLDGFGYSTEADTTEPWVKKGADVYVIHKGIPGRSDFEIVEMKSNG